MLIILDYFPITVYRLTTPEQLFSHYRLTLRSKMKELIQTKMQKNICETGAKKCKMQNAQSGIEQPHLTKKAPTGGAKCPQGGRS